MAARPSRSSRDGEERLVVVHGDREACRAAGHRRDHLAIRHAVSAELEAEVHAIRLIKPLTLPKTSSGKVQRHACRERFLDGTLEVVAGWTRSDPEEELVQVEPRAPVEPFDARAQHGPLSAEAIAAWLAAKVAVPLGMKPEEVSITQPFSSFGLGSLQAVQLAAELEQWLGRKLPAMLVYDYPTIDALARYLGERARSRRGPGQLVQPEPGSRQEPIAIIGIGCRFPGASGPEAFWRLLRDGVDAVGPVPDSRWDQDTSRMFGIPHRGGFLKDVDKFDADFFGISPREAIFIDPQHRLLLEVAWEAIEDAGRRPSVWRGRQSAFSSGSPRTTTPSSRRSEAARATAIGSPGMPPASRPIGSPTFSTSRARA